MPNRRRPVRKPVYVRPYADHILAWRGKNWTTVNGVEFTAIMRRMKKAPGLRDFRLRHVFAVRTGKFIR